MTPYTITSQTFFIIQEQATTTLQMTYQLLIDGEENAQKQNISPLYVSYLKSITQKKIIHVF